MPDPTPPQGADQPKRPSIIVDSDWKSQAQAEKERLAAQESAKKPPSGAPKAAPGPGAGPAATDPASPRADRLPPADFHGLISTLAYQAIMYLGGVADPETGRAIVSLEYARHAIDLLGVLEQKSKGNLSKEEADDLAEVMHELRMRYVQITDAVSRAEERMLKEESAARLRGSPPDPAST